MEQFWGMRAVAVASVVVGLTFGTMPAEAAPPGKPGKPSGPVSGLTMTVTHPDDYRVRTQWNSVPGATRYAVRMLDGSSAVVATDSVKDTGWSASTALSAGTRISVTVTPYVERKKGRSATVTTVLPDVTPPRGVYTVVRDQDDPTGGSVTIRRDELVDDVSSADGITQTIAWDEGGAAQPWPTGQPTASHDYGDEERLHHPVVTVTDGAGNTATYRLSVAVRDSQAPTGAYLAGPSRAFARWTEVSVAEGEVADNLSAADDIDRTVDWGDGTVETWTPALTHVYGEPGTYQPKVRLTDEAGNASGWIAGAAVEVVRDVAAPTTSLRVPRREARVSSWSTLRGRLDDGDGVGARDVTVKVAQKRRSGWFAYRASTATWERAATKRAALRGAEGTVRPSATDRWALRVASLRTGSLVVRYRGTDLLGNRTAWLLRQQRLSQR